jgi:putative transposase
LYGWWGLISQHQKAGRKKFYGDEVEQIAQEIIETYYELKTKPALTACYTKFVDKCMEMKVKPYSYNAFLIRVHLMSEIEHKRKRYGKKAKRDAYDPLGLFGKYPFGKFPLDTVEFDHGEMDIAIVDRKDRQGIGQKPILKLAVDVYSRMGYGYYMSLDHQSKLTVGMCFLRGIMYLIRFFLKYQTVMMMHI